MPNTNVSQHTDAEASGKGYETTELKLDPEYFISLLEAHGKPLTTKSRTTAAIQEKNAAMESICKRISTEKGIQCTSKQVKKKITNFRVRVQQKADLNRTGNKPVVLSNVEKRFWDLINGQENPSITKLPCK